MDIEMPSVVVEVANSLDEVDPKVIVNADILVQGLTAPLTPPPIDRETPIDAMASGDAPAPEFVSTASFSLRDVQDMILPDPSIVNLLPPLTPEQLSDHELSVTDVFHPMFLDQLKVKQDKEMTKADEDRKKDIQSSKLSLKDILEMQKLCNMKSEEDMQVKLDFSKVEVLFLCETCHEMPISSETVHTCSFGHQVCGSCYDNGVRTCVVCKGHLDGINQPMQNVLQRLRQNYPVLFYKCSPPTQEDNNFISRFFSLKPILCPEDGCMSQCSARSLLKHFKTEHKNVPTIDMSLFRSCRVLVPKMAMENQNGNVISVVNLKVSDKEVTSEMFTDTMTCWVQCGAVPMDGHLGGDGLVVWVSCAYEESNMPPVLYSARVSTPDSYTSFAGQMIPLHDYNGPAWVLNVGKCLLLFPDCLKRKGLIDEDGLTVELIFYLQ